MKKIIVITGATSGIGKATVKALIKDGHRLILLIRNVEKGLELENELNVKLEIIPCDLSDLDSVRSAAMQLKSHTDRIDVLINNAGGIFQDRLETKDGMEMHFGMNHLGHFLLTYLLMDVLTASKARIINLSSEAHKQARLNIDDIQLKNKYNALLGYANSKLCNILFTKELVRRYGNTGITSFAVHPGVVNTAFGDHLKPGWRLVWQIMKPMIRTPEKGAATSVFLATNPEVEKWSGNYFKDCKIAKSLPVADDESLANKLWDISLKYVKPFIS